MIKPEQIPDEVVKKVAGEWLMGASWPKIIAAAINAWPGGGSDSFNNIILPSATGEER